MMVDDGHRFDVLTQWLEGAIEHAEMPNHGDPPQLVETWQSRTATLHRFTWPELPSRDVVVKLHGTAAETEAHFASMRRLAEALEHAAQPDITAVKPLNHSVQLRAVLMPFVAGGSLTSYLVDGNWSTRSGREEIHWLVNRCGVLLATYHESQPQMGHDARSVAAERLHTRIERALEREVDLAGVPARGPVVQSYSDFHPGHVIITSDRKLALIDPPISVRYNYFYRDLALFSHNLYMSLIKPRVTLRNPLRVRHVPSLSQAFLEGYIATTNRTLTHDDMFYIRGWEAFYLARMLGKARLRRSYRMLSYYYLPMRHRLQNLRHFLTRHLEQAGQREG